MAYLSSWSDGIKPKGADIAAVKAKTDIIGASVALESAGNLAAVKTKTDLLDVVPSALQHTLLSAIASTVQKMTLMQKAAMDGAIYVGIEKSGNNYLLGTTLFNDATEYSVPPLSGTYIQTGGASYTILTNSTITIGITTNDLGNERHIYGGYTKNSTNVVDVVLIGSGIGTNTWQTGNISVIQNDVIRFWHHADGSEWGQGKTYNACVKSVTSPSLTGIIKSNAIVKDANIGLRYWGDINANLVAGAAGSTIKAKICNSAGTALHSNFVTIAAAEYARIPLERPVVLTATSGSQTVWNFTSLSNADAFINELGVLAKAIIVELALDGSTYTTLKEVTDFNEDISNILAPKITLVSGTGVVSGTSKLRATYIVNIPLSNTTIKLQVQLNRVVATDTSPSIQPFVGDATKYVGAGQVVIL